MVESEEGSPVNNNTKPGSILRVESDNEEEDLQSQPGSRSPAVLPKQSWLLRLFESTLFDPSMAMTYLFNSKEPGVLEYIGNKLFTFADTKVDFYLPQMINMYIMMPGVAEVIHPYLITRCRNSVQFSLACAWILQSYNTDALISTKKKSQGTRLKNLILSGELVPKELMKTPDDWKTSFKGHKLPSLRVGSGETSSSSTRPHE